MTEVKFDGTDGTLTQMYQNPIPPTTPLVRYEKEFLKIGNSYIRKEIILYIHSDIKNFTFVVGLNINHETLQFKLNNEEDFIKTQKMLEDQL